MSRPSEKRPFTASCLRKCRSRGQQNVLKHRAVKNGVFLYFVDDLRCWLKLETSLGSRAAPLPILSLSLFAIYFEVFDCGLGVGSSAVMLAAYILAV